MDESRRLLKLARREAEAARDLATKAEATGGFTAEQKKAFDGHLAEATRLKTESDRAKDAESQAILKELSADGGNAPHDEHLSGAPYHGGSLPMRGKNILAPVTWAAKAAHVLGATTRAAGVKAITSGSFELPATLFEAVTQPQEATHLLQLIPADETETNHFGYIRQTARTNNAAPVADDALKPTSLFSFEEKQDRARVVAHLSEPFPQRLIQDHNALTNLLISEMAYGVQLGIEDQVLAGNGLGENMTGVLNTTGVTDVPFATDVPTTLRKARTALALKSESPTAWVFNPTDAEWLDLLREDGATGDFLALERVLGEITFVVSNTVPVGRALLADWRLSRLYVRERSRLDVDAGGELFKRNQLQMRAEQRVGFGVSRPQAFAVVNLTPPVV